MLSPLFYMDGRRLPSKLSLFFFSFSSSLSSSQFIWLKSHKNGGEKVKEGQRDRRKACKNWACLPRKRDNEVSWIEKKPSHLPWHPKKKRKSSGSTSFASFFFFSSLLLTILLHLSFLCCRIVINKRAKNNTLAGPLRDTHTHLLMQPRLRAFSLIKFSLSVACDMHAFSTHDFAFSFLVFLFLSFSGVCRGCLYAFLSKWDLL